MHTSDVESKWVRSHAQQFAACGVGEGTVAAILCETLSRRDLVAGSRDALAQLGARAFVVELPTPAQTEAVAVRSTGASDATQGLAPVIAALAQTDIVIDCTVEGMLHSPDLPRIMAGGTRLMMVSSEHPEILERVGVNPGLEKRVKAAVARMKKAGRMHVSSAAGTDLSVVIDGCPAGGNWGYCTDPGTRSHWPGGLVAAFPKAGSVNGTLVFAPGDANLTFKRYFESHVSLRIEEDYITSIEGQGLDAQLLRSYIAAWGEREAYAVSHVGWGMNERARWDSMVMYDKCDFNGTELRVFAGNFLFSTGANEHAGRFTKGHFDLPMRNCTIGLDGEMIVQQGVLQGELAPAATA